MAVPPYNHNETGWQGVVFLVGFVVLLFLLLNLSGR